MLRLGDIPLFDASRYLDTPEARAEYLTAVMEDGTAEEIRHALDIVASAARADEASAGNDTDDDQAQRPFAEFAVVVGMMRKWGIGLSAGPLMPVE